MLTLACMSFVLQFFVCNCCPLHAWTSFFCKCAVVCKWPLHAWSLFLHAWFVPGVMHAQFELEDMFPCMHGLFCVWHAFLKADDYCTHAAWMSYLPGTSSILGLAHLAKWPWTSFGFRDWNMKYAWKVYFDSAQIWRTCRTLRLSHGSDNEKGWGGQGGRCCHCSQDEEPEGAQLK